MKKGNKFKNEIQLQLDFLAGITNSQEKEKKLSSLVEFITEDKTLSNETAQFVRVNKAESSKIVLSSGAFRSGTEEKNQLNDLSKKSSLSKLKESACSSKKPQAVFFDNLITVEELALVFGLAPQTIRNWVAQGKLPYVKVGKRNMFLKGSLQEWLNQKEVPQWQ